CGPSSLFRCLLQRTRIIKVDPFDDRNWQAAVFDQVIVELTQPEIVALFIFITAEQIHDLPLPGYVTDFLCWTGGCPSRFAFGRLPIQPAGIHEIFYGLFETPSAGVQIYINSDARGPIA